VEAGKNNEWRELNTYGLGSFGLPNGSRRTRGQNPFSRDDVSRTTPTVLTMIVSLTLFTNGLRERDEDERISEFEPSHHFSIGGRLWLAYRPISLCTSMIA
jgi:hypothetical protein